MFLRDCLALSLALGLNFKDGQIGNYTELGRLEHDAKTKADIASADELAEYAAKAICDLPYYKDADCVCAPPPRPNKPFDLPSHIASKVSATISKPDITSHLSCANARDEIKEASVDEKWDIWSEAGLQYNNNGFDVNGKNIILIDDKYQSGITLQFIAMKLQEAGANNVYGLCMVKTFGDKDNQ
ncbi:MAG: hypothetical protein HAW64_00860 [Alphaproteobacteria bacterium]|nr:hypothetical protein [Alphaproteobacteria bacterium]